MGVICSRQMSDYQRDGVVLDLQTKMNNLTSTLNSINSISTALDTRLYYIRESTFQSLQVLKVGLEQVHQDVLYLKSEYERKRRSQKLDYMDLAYDGYEVPRVRPPGACGSTKVNSLRKRGKIVENNNIYEDIIDTEPPKRDLGAKPKIITGLDLESRKGYLKMK